VTLTSKEVAEITRLLEESSFTELHLELNGLKISLKRDSAGSHEFSPAAAAAPVGTAVPEARPAAHGATPEAPDPRLHVVPAPLLGTFYRAPKPGAAPFVEVGSPVDEDTVVGIIEVMKLMNAVRAGVRGTVAQIVGRDGTLVEYGETLLRITRAS
jgi:acetyl-CoA carboxylase biotin carboxyl carrier protein